MCSIFGIFTRHIDSYLSLETTMNYWTLFERGHVSPTDYCVIFEPFSNNNNNNSNNNNNAYLFQSFSNDNNKNDNNNAHLNFLVRWVSFLLIT